MADPAARFRSAAVGDAPPGPPQPICQKEKTAVKHDMEFQPIKIENWAIFLTSRQHLMFSREEFCDLELVFKDGQKMLVHSLVVHACTDFFRIELEKQKTSKTIRMPESITMDVLKPTVQFMYTGRLCPKASNFEPLYKTAKLLGMNVVTRLMENLLQQTISKTKKAEEEKAKRAASLVQSPYRISNDLPTSDELLRSTPMFRCNFAPSAKPPLAKASPVASSGSRSDMQPCQQQQRQPVDDVYPADQNSVKIVPSSSSSSAQVALESAVDASPSQKPILKRKARDELASVTTAKKKKKKKMVRFSSEEEKEAAATGELKDSSTLAVPQQPEKSVAAEVKVSTGVAGGLRQKPVNPRSVPSTKYCEPVKMLTSADVFRKFAAANVKSDSASHGLGKESTRLVAKVIQQRRNLIKNTIKMKVMETTSLGGERIMYVTAKPEAGKKSYQIILNPNQPPDQPVSISPDGPWECSLCKEDHEPMQFESYASCREHHSTMHHQKFNAKSCQYCGFVASKRANLAHHQRVKHDVQSVYTFPECRECGHVSLDAEAAKKHKNKHAREKDKSYACSLWKGSGDKLKKFNFFKVCLGGSGGVAGRFPAEAGSSELLTLRNVQEENIGRANLRSQQEVEDILQDGGPAAAEIADEEPPSGEEEDSREGEGSEESEDDDDVASSSPGYLAVSSSTSPQPPFQTASDPVAAAAAARLDDLEGASALPNFQELTCGLPSNAAVEEDQEPMQVLQVMLPMDSNTDFMDLAAPAFIIVNNDNQPSEFQMHEMHEAILSQMASQMAMQTSYSGQDCGGGGLLQNGQWFLADNWQQQQQQQQHFQFMPQDVYQQQQQQPPSQQFVMPDGGCGANSFLPPQQQQHQFNSHLMYATATAPTPAAGGSHTFQIAAPPQYATMQFSSDQHHQTM